MANYSSCCVAQGGMPDGPGPVVFGGVGSLQVMHRSLLKSLPASVSCG